MARGGKRQNAGRKANQPESAAQAESPRKALAAYILSSLGKPDWKCPNKCQGATCEICLWRSHAIKDRSALEYLWNREGGKPAQMIHHTGAQADQPLRILVEHIGQSASHSPAAKTK